MKRAGHNKVRDACYEVQTATLGTVALVFAFNALNVLRTCPQRGTSRPYNFLDLAGTAEHMRCSHSNSIANR